MTKVVQLKLVSGEEIMCKIHKKGFFNYEIKDALMFIKRINEETGTTYYAFIPFMTQVNHKESIITLKKNTVIAVSKPAKLTEVTYAKYVETENEAAINREDMTDEVILRMKQREKESKQKPPVKDSDINVTYSIDKSKLN